MNYSGKEKRKHSRLPIDVQFRLIMDNHEYSGKLSNISLSGAYLATIEPKLATSSITQQGSLHIGTGNGWVEVACEIVYLESESEIFPHGVGVTFCQGNEEAISKILDVR